MRPKLLVVLVAVLNLAAGASFGFIAGRASRPPVAEIEGPPPDLAVLADALDLPPERAAKVRELLASCGPRFDAVVDETRPKLRALHEQILGELGKLLTPDELSRLFDEFHRRYGDRLPHQLR
jgi:hypothetical protein